MTGNLIKIKLPRRISQGMVLQRNKLVKIWGWAPPREVITVHFMGKVYPTLVEEDGKWLVSIPTENTGGPYDMEIERGEGANLYNREGLPASPFTTE